MKIRVGYELIYDFPQPTPMIMVLGIHFTRASNIVVPDHLMTSPSVPIFPYRDVFGNWCSRIVAPSGRVRLWADGVVSDTGQPDLAARWATQHAFEDLPGARASLKGLPRPRLKASTGAASLRSTLSRYAN